MVIVHNPYTGDAVLVEVVASLPLLGAAHVPVASPRRAVPSTPRRRDVPPMVGRDNSTTRYQAVKDFKLGVRRQRRWDNFLGLKHTLKALGHDEEEGEEPIVPARASVLSTLLHDDSSMRAWESFVSCSPEEQSLIVRFAGLHIHGAASDHGALDLGVGSPARCYLRIDRSIRLAMRRRHVPLGLVEYLEAQIVESFTADAETVMLTELPDSYSRMLQHGICQYMGLKSASDDVDGVRVTTITHPDPALGFSLPSVLLSAILSHASS